MLIKNESDLIPESQNETRREQEEREKNLLIPHPRVSTKFKNPILVKTLSLGAMGLGFATYMAANGKLLAMLGDQAGGASTIVLPYQAVVVGTGVGFVFGMGLEMAGLNGREEYIKAGEVVRAGWILILGAGGLGSIAMISTRGFFPLIFNHNTATTALSFFTGCSIGNIPMLMFVSDSLVAFEAGDWFIPFVMAFFLPTLSTTCSYLLGFQAELGALGIGLGSSLGPIAICAAMRAWFSRSSYEKYALCQFYLTPELNRFIKVILKKGSILSLQRLTEWLNLFIVTSVIGMESNLDLIATNPAIQYAGLVAATMQGMAAAIGMMVNSNNSKFEKAIAESTDNKIDEQLICRNNNLRVIVVSNLCALGFSLAIGGSFYLASKPLTQFFLPATNSMNMTNITGAINITNITGDANVTSLANRIFYTSIFGYIPDGISIALMGALRGYNDILFSTILRLFLMTLIGVPAGWGFSRLYRENQNNEENCANIIFYFRNGMMLLVTFILAYRCHKKWLNSAEIAINAASTLAPSCSPTQANSSQTCRFFNSNRQEGGEENTSPTLNNEV